MRVIGLISGTSVDGIDAALVDISGTTHDLSIELLAGATYPYPDDLRQHILAVCAGHPLSMEELAELDDAIAHQFAQAALAIQSGHSTAALIGSHGQTVFHRSPSKNKILIDGTQTTPILPRPHSLTSVSLLGYSLQLGRGALIAHLTGISTVSNFRVADIAVGGEGAPLVSALDVALFAHPTYSRCIQNIGGIGNVTYLPANCHHPEAEGKNVKPESLEDIKKSPSPRLSVCGWDTGPGNVLLDLAVQHFSHKAKSYDQDGAWAASGTPCQTLVDHWLQQEFFQIPPPKSTGRELFSPSYFQECLTDAEKYSLESTDILATLTEFTAASIALSYQRFLPQSPDQVLLCGGGSKNLYLKQRLQAHLKNSSVLTTDELGFSADFKEAIAFAALAYWRKLEIPGNLPEVTGAQEAVLLGEIHQVG